jgi:PAS domain S-box-containing protein
MPDERQHSPSLKASAPILTVDRESAIVAANPAACRLLGSTEEALRGAPFLARVVAAERPAAGVMLGEGLRGRTGEASMLLHCVHAEARRFLVRVVPVLREGEAPNLLLMLRDLGVEAAEDESRSVAERAAQPDVRSFDAVVRAADDGMHARADGARHADRTGGPATVLVIDDDEALRGSLRRSLEAGGYRVLEAGGGRHALAQLREGRAVDLVLTDLKMEDGSGGWLLAQLAYEHPDLLPFTLVMAGDAGGAGAAHIASRWRCPVLAKPFSREELVSALTALERNSGGPASEG